MTFDPNDIGVKNGNIFGFPVTENEAEIVIIPVPWDVTASYRKGTSKAPGQILEASTQLDFFHSNYEGAHKIKVYMSPISEDMQSINEDMKNKSIEYLRFLEDGGEVVRDSEYSLFLEAANEAHENITDAVYDKATNIMNASKIPAVLGGEHSAPLGLIKALGTKFSSFGVLQLDAHADLRSEYEGFHQSHASIFHNVLEQIPQVSQVVQVGIRDLSDAESERINHDDKLMTYFDWQLKEERFNGRFWQQQVQEIIAELPQNVYISFDIDCLKPSLCPNTGTPVPGGFEFEEISYLLHQLAASGKSIIGFDLCEVGDGEWDAMVGARCLWELVVSTQISREMK